MTYPFTLYLEEDQRLGSALVLLDNAVAMLNAFAERHPDRMDATIADAMSHAIAAHAALDSTFYADGEADPNYEEDS